MSVSAGNAGRSSGAIIEDFPGGRVTDRDLVAGGELAPLLPPIAPSAYVERQPSTRGTSMPPWTAT